MKSKVMKDDPKLGQGNLYDHKDGVGLRKIQKGDLYRLLSLKLESWWGTHHSPIINIEDQQKWYDSIPDDQLFMIATKNEKPIGLAIYTDIDYINRSLNISGSIFSEFRADTELVKAAFSCGLDFGFEFLNMRRIGAEVLEYHLAAQYLEINHLGFTVEGRRRKAVYKSGLYYDSICLGLLRDEWEEQDRVLSYMKKDGTCNLNFDAFRAERLSQKTSEVARK